MIMIINISYEDYFYFFRYCFYSTTVFPSYQTCCFNSNYDYAITCHVSTHFVHCGMLEYCIICVTKKSITQGTNGKKYLIRYHDVLYQKHPETSSNNIKLQLISLNTFSYTKLDRFLRKISLNIRKHICWVFK